MTTPKAISRVREVTPAVPRHADVVSLDFVRGELATVWVAGAGAVILLVVLQSLLGRFGGKTSEAWGWLLPTTMPTLLLIVTVLGYTALDPVHSTAVVRRRFHELAKTLSIAYLSLVALTVLIGPFAAADGAGMIDLMHMSNLWLGPFQGLVASALGVLFVTKQGTPVAAHAALPPEAVADMQVAAPIAVDIPVAARPSRAALPSRFPAATRNPVQPEKALAQGREPAANEPIAPRDTASPSEENDIDEPSQASPLE